MPATPGIPAATARREDLRCSRGVSQAGGQSSAVRSTDYQPTAQTETTFAATLVERQGGTNVTGAPGSWCRPRTPLSAKPGDVRRARARRADGRRPPAQRRVISHTWARRAARGKITTTERRLSGI
jgi:hypothetical protein